MKAVSTDEMRSKSQSLQAACTKRTSVIVGLKKVEPSSSF